MSLRRKTISGLIWSAISQGGKQTSQIVITAILARLLAPSDFGMLSMATVFTGFVSIFSELGVSSALIQKQDANEKHYSSAFWLNVLVGLGLTIGFILIAPLIAAFYQKPELKPILVVLSLNFFLSSFAIIQQAVLTKDMNFKALMLRDIVAVIIAGFAGIVCAYHGFGIWSLIVQLFVFTLVNNVFLWGCSKWRPKFILDRTALKDLFHFSFHLMGFQTVNYFARNLDSLLIGRFLGSQALGYYALAYKLMLFPLQNFTWTISRVMFPAFSKIQSEFDKVRLNYLKMLKAVALVSFPIMTYVFVIAPDLIHVVYGERWGEVVPLVQVFCFCGMVQSIGSLGGIIYLATGKVDVQFKMSLISTLLLAVILFIAVNYGIRTVAIAYTLYYLIWTQASLFIVSKLISLDLLKVYKAIFIPFALAMSLFGLLLVLNGCFVLQPLLKIIVLGVFAVVIYGLSMLATKQMTISKNFHFQLCGI